MLKPPRVLSRPVASGVAVLALLGGAAAFVHPTDSAASHRDGSASAATMAADQAPRTGTADLAGAPATGLSDPVEDSYYPDIGDPGIDVLTTDLRLRWSRASRTLAGTADLLVRATQDAPLLQLDLAAPLTVSHVQVTADASGETLPAEVTHPGKDLRIHLPVRQDAQYRLRVDYGGHPGTVPGPSSRSDISRLGWQTLRDGEAWSMQEPYGAYSWFPSNDQPSDKAVYSVRLDVPRNWVGISNGLLASRTVAGSRTITRFTNAAPMSPYLMTVAIGPYRRVSDTGPHGLPLTYWVPRSHPAWLKPLRDTPATLRWLESQLGRYPFDRAGVVAVPHSDSAMETQTLVTLGGNNYRWGGRQVKEVVAHELAHSWYGDSVTPKDWRDVWMSEGMAMYLEGRYTVAQGWVRWKFWQREFTRDDGYYRRVYGPPGAYKPDQFGQTNVYYCPARMWERLRTTLGDAEFSRLVRGWPQTHRWSNQGREDLVAWMSHEAGRDLTDFFDTWLLSPTAPA